MIISELIEQLRKYPPEMRVVVSGYEGGYNDISLLYECRIILNVNTEKYYGQHESAVNPNDPDAVPALLLAGMNHNSEEGDSYAR